MTEGEHRSFGRFVRDRASHVQKGVQKGVEKGVEKFKGAKDTGKVAGERVVDDAHSFATKAKERFIIAVGASPPEAALQFRAHLRKSKLLPDLGPDEKELAEHERALYAFALQQMAGNRLSMSRSRKVGEAQDALSRFHEVEELLSGLLGFQPEGDAAQVQEVARHGVAAASDPNAAAKALAKDLAKEVAKLAGKAVDVNSAIEALFGAIPGLNVLTGLVITAEGAAKLLKHGSRSLPHEAAKRSSMSAIERATLHGITRYERRVLGRDLGRVVKGGVYTGASMLVPGGGTAVTAGGLASRILARIIELMMDWQRVYDFNHPGKDSQPPGEDRQPPGKKRIRGAVIPTLYLPQLPGVDAMVLLGIAPVGWRNDSRYSTLQSYAVEHYPWLLDKPEWDETSKKYTFQQLPKGTSEWQRSADHLADLVGEADVWMAVPPWSLLKGRGGEPVWRPKQEVPNDIWRDCRDERDELLHAAAEKLKKERDELLQAAAEKLKSRPTPTPPIQTSKRVVGRRPARRI